MNAWRWLISALVSLSASPDAMQVEGAKCAAAGAYAYAQLPAPVAQVESPAKVCEVCRGSRKMLVVENGKQKIVPCVFCPSCPDGRCPKGKR